MMGVASKSGSKRFHVITGIIIIIMDVVLLVNGREGKRMGMDGCDLFKGRWVYDETYPLYDVKKCPFVGSGFDCLKNGRPDRNYLKHRWSPLGCHLPRFNGRELLQKWRGKRIMFVGDSLSFNQWESLTCMLHSAVPNSPYSLLQRGALSSFTFHEYGVSIMMLKNGFLVDVVTEKIGKVLVLDSISSGRQWKGADVLIFNSDHWWYHRWEWYRVGGTTYRNMDHTEAFKIALTTWAKWVDLNIDHSKTRVFFQGVSASHINGSEWGEPRAKNCIKQTRPVEGSTYPGGADPGEDIVRRIIATMKHPAYLLDVTLLTQLRKDGHPSIYAGVSDPRYIDCSHWCLPGIPDTWNELLYAALI